MVEGTRGITVKVPEEIHAQAKAEQESLELTMSQYIELVLQERFRKGGKTMGATRTLAFQVSEELFQQVKRYLAAHPGLTQKDFVIELIERALEEFEAEEATAAAAGEQEAQEPADAPDADDTEESPDKGDDGENTATEDDTDSLESDNPDADEPDSGGWEGTDDTEQEDPSEPDEDDD